MAQVNIQLDLSTFRSLEMIALRRNTSVSQWIKDRVKTELKQEWPKNYFSLFGALKEGDLDEPQEIAFSNDSQREKL